MSGGGTCPTALVSDSVGMRRRPGQLAAPHVLNAVNRNRPRGCAARVLFVLAIIKNTVFCKVMLGFQQDVSSDTKARFTLAMNTIKTVASNIMEKLVTLEP